VTCDIKSLSSVRPGGGWPRSLWFFGFEEQAWGFAMISPSLRRQTYEAIG